jgi:spore cortex biosynthesis protein YabQ
MIENQAYLFLVFSLTGVIIGALFDIFRVLRKSFKTADIITYIEDVLFWILTGILVLYNIWYFNDGEIRLFMFLGIIMGVLIYLLTLSRLFINLVISIINIIKKIVKFLEIPFRPIIKICKKICMKFKDIMSRTIREVERMTNLQNKRGKIEKSGE